MPTVLRKDGFDFCIISGDHDPPHVHVRHGDAEVIIVIESGEIRGTRGRESPETARAQTMARRSFETDGEGGSSTIWTRKSRLRARGPNMKTKSSRAR
jgi:hypothetical protein